MMIANHYLSFRQYSLTATSASRGGLHQVPGKAVYSLRNVKKITYEDNSKTLSIFYFREPFPETICNVDATMYQQVITTLSQTEECVEPFEGNPDNQF